MNPYSFGVAGLGIMHDPLPVSAAEGAIEPNQFYPALPGFTVMMEAPPSPGSTYYGDKSLYLHLKLGTPVDVRNYALDAKLRAYEARVAGQPSARLGAQTQAPALRGVVVRSGLWGRQTTVVPV